MSTRTLSLGRRKQRGSSLALWNQLSGKNALVSLPAWLPTLPAPQVLELIPGWTSATAGGVLEGTMRMVRSGEAAGSALSQGSSRVKGGTHWVCLQLA